MANVREALPNGHVTGHDDPDQQSQYPQWGRLTNSDLKAGSPWARKVVLSLDGGGVKGYSSLLILKKLMEMVKDFERKAEPSHRSSADYCWSGREHEPSSGDFLMHHYVDYFVGTSTGGLTAIMLGRLKMSIRETFNLYYDVGEKVFQHPRRLSKGNLRIILGTRLSGKRMEQVLKEATAPPLATGDVSAKAKKKLINVAADHELMRDPNQQSARTVVVAHSGEKYLFRSYDRPSPNPDLNGHQKNLHLNPGPASIVPLWKVARATSAAPGWFPAIHIDQVEYQDGALAECNNPVNVAYNEVKQVHPFHEPMVIISIGTGDKRPKHIGHGKANGWFPSLRLLRQNAKRFKEKLLDSDGIHQHFMADHDFQQHVKRDVNSSKAIYFRFDVPLEFPIVGVQLGDWKGAEGAETRDAMRRPTNQYMEQDETAKELRRCARILVDIRRRRQATARWETFADDNLYYRCPERSVHATCKDLRFNSRLKLRRHAIEHHNIVWGIKCCHHARLDDGTQVQHDAVWTCFWDHCEERASTFDHEADFIIHLQTAHVVQQPQIKERRDFERWLDTGRAWLNPSETATMNRRGVSGVNRTDSWMNGWA